MLGRCLIVYGKQVPINGSVIYCSGWDSRKDVEFFRNNLYGFYNYGLTVPQRRLFLNQHLPKLKPFMDEIAHTKMVEAVTKAKELYEIDTHVHAVLMGFKDVLELYDNMMISGYINRI